VSPQPFTVPEARPDDEENVAWALLTSANLYRAGNLADALRWLRRAAMSASESGRDARAVDLYRAAAELAERVPKDATAGAAVAPRVDAVKIQTQDAVAPTVPGEVIARRRALAAVSGTNAKTLPEVKSHSIADEATMVPLTERASDGAAAADSLVPDTTRASLRALSSIPASSRRSKEADKEALADEATMTSMSSFRVAVLASPDGAPRIVRLASGAKSPEGAAKAVLVASSSDDAKLLAALLGIGS
jgi:hypothetical protein